ncbi:adenine phosphoribosyltransferase [Enterobacter asburiae]|uniref:Adenine phosphoribosyltransferase n=1 Tax=Enterobacter asburiae TaxID=61645 RepID=A0A376F4J2_ENTAS|nr:adenine phosphoribosyltransferase [Enterobacter asburiae]
MTATAQQLEYLKNSIKSIQDYPKPGILFRDVTSLLEDPKAYALSIELLVERYKNAGITKVVGTEARGFLFGAPVALAMGVGFVPVRKPRKLPRVKPLLRAMSWSTAPISWRSTWMRSNLATKCWWWTICWQPAVPLKRP